MKDRFVATAAILLAGTSLNGTAMAQGAEPGAAEFPTTEADIVVTARKRDESIMRTPVIIQAITQRQIESLKITDMASLSSVTPSLRIGPAFSAVGAAVYLRGLGNGENVQMIDQSVALNIDGVTTGHGAFYRTGLFDIGQIEVLKGPQALFFGKSTSAGIIAIHSADPTPEWEMKLTSGYEFKADEFATDAYISGPLTENLGFRLAGFYDSIKGWLYSPNPNVREHRIPNQRDYGGRASLVYDGGAGLRVKLKTALLHTAASGGGANITQLVCTNATAQKNFGGLGYYDNCNIDNVSIGSPDPQSYRPGNYTFGNPAAFRQGTFSKLIGEKGRQYTYTNTRQIILNVDYDISDGLSLSSVSGYNWVRAVQSSALPLSATSLFEYGGRFTQKEFSEEVRLTSDWKDSWFNFMIGGLYYDAKAVNYVDSQIPAFTLTTSNQLTMDTRNWSAFGQVLLTPVKQIELSLGVRYTDLVRSIPSAIFNSNTPSTVNKGELVGILAPNVQRIAENNTSPEATLSYRPNDDLTFFVSYKRGYKAPGYNFDTTASSFNPATSVFPFAGERARGFEGGIKASLLDRRLNLTFGAYRYNYLGQQVSFVDLSTAIPIILTSNGANARVQGVELGANYSPVEGLRLNGFLNYNDAYYTQFTNSPCYGGQGTARGCIDIDPGPTNAFVQDLTGRQLHRAPKWSGQFGVDYQTAVSDDLSAGMSFNMNYSSSYNVSPEQNPNGVQKSYVTFDATARFGKLGGPWEVALIGRNLTNRYIFAGGADAGQVTPNVIADASVYIYRPRQLMLQMTIRPQF